MRSFSLLKKSRVSVLILCFSFACPSILVFSSSLQMLSLARNTVLPFSKVRLPFPVASQEISCLLQNRIPKRQICTLSPSFKLSFTNSFSTSVPVTTFLKSSNTTSKNFYQFNQHRFFASRKAKKMRKEKARQEKQAKRNRGKVPPKAVSIPRSLEQRSDPVFFF